MDRGTRQRLAGLTVALVLVTPLSVVAARWQWNRHLERDALNLSVVRAEKTAPVPWERLAQGPGFSTSTEWRRVTADGQWLPSAQMLVRKQVVEGEVGFTVYTPFVTSDGHTLSVLRGWVQFADAHIPAPPAGETRIVLRVRMVRAEGSIRPSDLPPGQINFVDPALMHSVTPPGTIDPHSQAVPAVFELLAPAPVGLVSLPWPELTSGPHLSYFLQWILIGLTGIVVYVRVFRSEWRLSRETDTSALQLDGRADPDQTSD